MLRALVWKEWREQRPLVIAGVALAAVMPVMLFTVATATMPGFSNRRLADLTVLAFVLLMWPMFTAAAGAGTFANESSGRTLGFLLSRPVARRNIWVVKVALAAFAITVVIAASWVIVNVVSWLAGAQGAANPSLAAVDGALDESVIALLGLYLCFSAAVFLSAHVGRPLAATIGGLAITMLTVVILIVLWPRVGLLTSFSETWIKVEALVAATMLLALSLHRFTSAEAGTASSLARTLSSVALMIAVTAAVGFAPALYADIFADLDRAVTYDFALSPSGDTAVVTAAQYPSMKGSLWRLPDEAQGADGGAEQLAPRRLTRRLAFSPFFSPDGQWVYYFTARRPGMVSGDVDLRAVRIDGAEDRLVIGNMGEVRDVTRQGWPRPAEDSVASPDGSRVVFGPAWWGEEAMVIDLERGTARKIVVDPTPEGGREFLWQTAEPVAWSRDDDVVFHVRAGHANYDYYHAIVVYDIAAEGGASRFALRRSDTNFFSPFYFPSVVFGPYSPGLRLPVQLRDFTRSHPSGDSFWELAVVDTDTGGLENIEDFPCEHPRAAVSADGNVVAYRRFASCVQAEDGDLEGVDPVLVIRNLQTGGVEEYLDGDDRASTESFYYIGVSPGGSRVSLYVGNERGASVFKIIEADRTVRTINVRRVLGGALLWLASVPRWIDEDHLMVRYSTRGSTRYLRFGVVVVLDVNDGSVVHEFVIPSSGGGVF